MPHSVLSEFGTPPAGRSLVVRRIREVVRLLAPDGWPVPEFLLHIEGEYAWWRWGDEPFPEPRTSRSTLARHLPR